MNAEGPFPADKLNPPTASEPTPPAERPSDRPVLKATAPDRNVLEVIRGVKSGEISGRMLGAEERRRCVAHLVAEGYSVYESAEILKVSERTIHRDKDAIRRANALSQDPALAGEVAGHLLQQADANITALGRIVRDRDTPAAARIDAIKARWQVACQLSERLQSLGYLPEAARQVRADLTHRLAQPASVEALQAQFSEIETLLGEVAPEDPTVRERAAALRQTLGHLSVASEMNDLRQAMDTHGGPTDGQAATHPPVVG